MQNEDKKDPAGKIWNNQQQKGDLNEGFSGENIPEDYNPKEHLQETETDSEGNQREVSRARNADITTDDESKWNEKPQHSDQSEAALESQKIKGTEDFNYDENPERLSKEENQKNRGNGHSAL